MTRESGMTMTTEILKEEISFPAASASFQLLGTLRLPSSTVATSGTTKKLPAAIIIHGSGPVDRDGNAHISLGTLAKITTIELNTHNRLAETLVKQSGMAVLCYDKRGIGKSIDKHNKNVYYQAGLEDLVQDAIQAYRHLLQDDRIDGSQIFFIGHSEGAIILPLIAERMKTATSTSASTTTSTTALPPPSGLVFLAGFGETLDGAARNQQQRLLQEVSKESGLQGWILRKVITKEKLDKQYSDLMEQIEESKKTNQDYSSQYCGLVKTPTKWYREHLEWDSTKSLNECRLPCLAITGGKDVQVNPEYCSNIELAKKIVPNAASLETHVIANMTHILRSIDTDKEIPLLSVQKEYPKLGKQPLDEELVTLLVKWIEKQVGEEKGSASDE